MSHFIYKNFIYTIFYLFINLFILFYLYSYSDNIPIITDAFNSKLPQKSKSDNIAIITDILDLIPNFPHKQKVERILLITDI